MTTELSYTIDHVQMRNYVATAQGSNLRRNVTYKELVEKLAALGVTETSENIANKISRGKFTAVFLVQCLEAIGCTALRLD